MSFTFTTTHVSVNDGTPVMAVSTDPFVVINEDGTAWLAEPSNWVEPEKEWQPMTLSQVKAYLAGYICVGSPPEFTDIRETEHGVEYR